MNAEQLHALALAVQADLSETNSVAQLGTLRDALQSIVDEPTQPAHQEQVSSTLSQLSISLERAPSNQFTPARQQILAEIGAIDLLGQPLLYSIQEILGRNQITPSVALSEIDVLLRGVTDLKSAIDGLADSMALLDIGAEELEPGTSELGMLIPRSSVSQLDEYATELSIPDRTLNYIATRIDKGYNFEIRAEPADSAPADGEDAANIAIIQGASRNMRFLNVEGEPILSLPNPDDEDGVDEAKGD